MKRISWYVSSFIYRGEKPFTCSICGDTFRQRDGLKRHELIKHNPTQVVKYTCEVCKKDLLSRYSYRKHVEKHYTGNKKDFKCNQCEKKFSSKASLKNHLCLGDVETAVNCTECDKEFSTKALLAAHAKTHEDIKPTTSMSCDKCDVVFSDKQDYCTHIQLHHSQPVKKFKCDQCNKAFLIKYVSISLNRPNETFKDN